MTIRKAHVAGTGEFSIVMTDGINSFVLTGLAGDVHAGLAPPQAAAGCQIGWLGLFIAKNQAIGGMKNGGALEIERGGE